MRILALALVLLSALPPAEATAASQKDAPAAVLLPAEIPLFPLPQVVLFPGVRRPLMIVEPRYRDMVADALKGSGIIGMILLKPGFERDYDGRPPIYEIGCAGEIDDYQQLPDGRYAILLRGVTAFRVKRELGGKTYRLAQIDVIADRLPDADRLPLHALRERLVRALYTVGLEAPDERLEDVDVVHFAAQSLGLPDARLQELLERDRVLDRATLLQQWVDRGR